MVERETKKEIAVIGRDEFTLGFKLAGVRETYGKENYSKKLQELLEREDLGILIVEDNDLEELSKRVRNQVDKSVDPVVVALSDTGESERVNEKIRKVIGADIT